MDLKKILHEKLKIPPKYLKSFSKCNKVEGIVHRSWLSQLLSEGRVPSEFVLHNVLSPAEVEAWLKQGESIGPSWRKLMFKVVQKRAVPVIPLPRAKPHPKPDTVLSYCQVLHYVSHTNHKNLWKEIFKKYSTGWVTHSDSHKRDRSKVRLTDSASVLRDVIARAYGCPVISLDKTEASAQTHTESPQSHPNMLPCLVALESSDYFILVFDGAPSHTLLDCVTFSPALLSSHSCTLFLIYQLLSVLRHIHDLGLVLGDVSLADVHVDQHLWIQVLLKLESNLYELPQKTRASENINVPKPPLKTEHISGLTLAWVRGAMSNLDYLTNLNKLAGRRYGDPRCHYVLPWVTDFSSHNGANWRDLTRSKFRLNKGDRQLDLTYELPPSSNTAQVPHHVSDVLSEITYYVYLARVTPRSVLCRYVRPQWVPAEYPSSIQRLQQWTPDECIPEFFTDPSVFKSIHPDLPDLELPTWATSAEQLIAHHRAALESNYVSNRLHHWIDLTFGYKLSGQAAVKSKNVCLQLVDGHTGLADCGVVQLFSTPHPQRTFPSPYWGVAPPRIHHRDRRRPGSDEDEEGGPSSGGEDTSSAPPLAQTPQSSPLGLSRILSRSRTSLQTSGSSPQGTIVLPHDYNPLSMLASVEAMHAFGPETTQGDADTWPDTLSQAKQMVAAARHQEMQVLGCLVVEMCLATKLRLFDQCPSFLQRLSTCRSVLSSYRDSIPRCLRSLVTLLLDDSGSESPVTSMGTPSPSAHQLLQPALSASLLPLPTSFPIVYSLVAGLHEHSVAVTVLQQLRESHPDQEEQLTACIERLSEWKVQSAAKCLQQLMEQPHFSVDLVLSHVKELLTDQDTAVPAAWLLFDPVAKALGPTASVKVLLEPMVRLYDSNPSKNSHRALKKRLKLYHRSFLLQLIVRFRLRTFLDHFVTLLVEAVGGCHDVDFVFTADSTGHTEDVDNTECPGILSPLDEDSSADSEKVSTVKKEDLEVASTETELEPEVFVLETEDSREVEDQSEQIASLLLDLQADDVEEIPTEVPVQLETQRNAHFEEEQWMGDEEEHKPAFEYSKSHLLEVSEVGVASVQWLSHRLGPVLTATHLTRNLLRMLSLCYAGPGLTTQNGDDNAAGVLQCLAAVVELYGEQFIVVQYLPMAADVVTQARRRLTASLEGGVVGHLSLLTRVLPLLSNNTLNNLFQEMILSRICNPCLRLLATTRQLLPSGQAGRRAIASRLVLTLQALMIRASTEQKIALIHTISRLFLVFSKARDQLEDSRAEDPVSRVRDIDCSGSFSPPQSNTADGDSIKSKALEELSAAMTAELAHWAYTPFANFFGESLMEQSLKNHSLIKQLCAEHKHNCDSNLSGDSSLVYLGDSDVEDSVGSFGTNVIVIGNRIVLHEPIAKSASPSTISVSGEDNTDNSSKQVDNTSRHLRGNWLSYWQHEVSTGHSSAHLDVKQIRLLGFSGHTNSVRALSVLDNENSFLSASRDKTVKVWSLRSMGDGSTVCPAQWTYSGHRKCVLSVGFCEAARLAVSCDSSVHLWDPYIGRLLAQTDPTKTPPVNTLKPMPPPSFQVLAATTDPTLRTLDTRVGGYVNELKVPSSSAGLIRCIAVSPGGNTVALGQASGHLTVMDLRTGSVLSAWRAHDAEILQLLAVNDHTIVSSSLDQAISVWNPSDGKLKFNMKGPTEPVHCLDLYGSELVSGTTANRIGVHTTIDPTASFSSTRLRADGVRGVITNIQVLPLNRLLLLGVDTGAITLIC